MTIVQQFLHWEDSGKNRAAFGRSLEKVESTDLIVLPEMFPTGFSMRPEKLAEPVDGPSTEWMRKIAAEKNAVVTGSIITLENGHYYNRLVWMKPDGRFETYDKRHLFSFANEHNHYTAGESRLATTWKGWRICPLVCYDLRFPVWSRNQGFTGTDRDFVYDVLIYVANWPEARSKPWKTLLEARAHENQAYVVGVNRIGEDGNGIGHTGDSGIYSPKGDLLTHLAVGEAGTETVELDWQALADFREKFTPWKDKDRFNLEM